MKISIRGLRNIIKETLLFEEACPGCGRPGAYVGFSDVECSNTKCRFYSAKQANLTGNSPTLDYTVNETGTKVINIELLRQIAPRAEAAIDDPYALNKIWIMFSPDDTNEEELAEDMAINWDDCKVTVDGQEIVILCGSYDDEYGNIWDESAGVWHSYMY